MMRVLFVHQNFPGQFRHVFKALVAHPEYDVRALCMREPEAYSDKIIDCRAYLQAPKSSSPIVDDFAAKIARGMATSRAATALKFNGFVPDVIVGHPGWGEMLFLRDTFPDARIVALFELFYRAECQDVGFDPEFPVSQEELWGLQIKNTANHFALEACDIGVSPTQWQRDTYPEKWHDKIKVIHEGIDTDFFQADPRAQLKLPGGNMKRGDGLITFVARNLEPYRGFHTAMRALPQILRDNPTAKVVFVGAEGVSYGKHTLGGQSWRKTLQDELGQSVDWSRVMFMGHVPYEVYRRILQISTVHIYLTYPFILSWSMLDAMSCECAIVASDTAPVAELIEDGREGVLVDFFDPTTLAAQVTRLMGNEKFRERLGKAARSRVREQFGLRDICLPAFLNIVGET
jgi:glycosyltransferase involved in cell wall biosynthesis